MAERLTTPRRLRAALENRPRLRGRRILPQLIGKLHSGCRGELEIWGYDHAGPADRERDLRRDAALAAKGITVVRLTHDYLTGRTADVQREVTAILAARQRAA